jgi:hypothetical protein
MTPVLNKIITSAAVTNAFSHRDLVIGWTPFLFSLRFGLFCLIVRYYSPWSFWENFFSNVRPVQRKA